MPYYWIAIVGGTIPSKKHHEWRHAKKPGTTNDSLKHPNLTFTCNTRGLVVSWVGSLSSVQNVLCSSDAGLLLDPTAVTLLTIPTWMLRLVLCLWLVATTEAEDNVLGEVCQVSMNFELATIMHYIKILPECIILCFFMEQTITLHRGSRGIQDSNNGWRRLGLINLGITFWVNVSEIMVGLITIRQCNYVS